MKRRLFSMMLAIMVLFTSVDVSVFAREGQKSGEICIDEEVIIENDATSVDNLFLMEDDMQTAEFSIRNTPPSSNNSYYYGSNGYTGYSMPNCTAYAYGRVYEINGTKPKVSMNNANTWFDYNKNGKYYSYSEDAYSPQVGAVVCYTTSSAGHVQVVEEIGEDGNGKYICVSESNYSGREKPQKSFNYIKIYLDNLNASKSSGRCYHTKLEDNDGYAHDKEGDLNYTYITFQGYIYTCPNLVTYHNPRGVVETIAGGEGYIDICGWVFDEDVPTESLKIHVYVGGGAGSGAPCYEFTANQHRPDVGRAYPGVGDNHGYSEIIYTNKTGAVDVYIYGINGGAGGTNVEIGHGTANVTADTTAPKVINKYVQDVSKDGYTVIVEATDNVGVTRVRFPTWRSNDQDGGDALWYEGVKQEDGTWRMTININDFDNVETTYQTHIYAYDAAENRTFGGGISQYIDRTKPVISNVQFDRISADTVRVSCQVTDNTEVTKVSFPTWTSYNVQDDLKEPWVDNYDGIRNGSTWTYGFKDSEHNYERGLYVVHIYAWDEYDNSTQLRTDNYDFQNLYEVIATQTNGHRYELYDDILTWEEAKAKCEELGGHLVTITSQEEQDLMIELMSEGGREHYQIGGHLQNGSMSWVTGEAFDYTNWATGEPNNYEGHEDVSMMYKNGTWNDTSNEDIGHGFICEYDTVTYTINFDKNSTEATGSMSALAVETGSSALLNQNQFVRTGYTFTGWNTKADGSGTAYADKAAVAALATGSETQITLYAQWGKKQQAKAPVANIASGSVVEEGTRITLSSDTTGAEIYYTTDGSVPTKASSRYTQPITMNQTMTIKAIAVKDGYLDSNVATFTYTLAQKVIYTITFDKNGSDVTGTMAAQVVEKGSNGVLNSNQYMRNGYTFTGWNTKADGSGRAYADRAGIAALVSGTETAITLYAQWEQIPQVSAPTASIASGSVVEEGAKVALSCTESGAEIYYTTDGSVPTKESIRYTTPITVNGDITIKAIAYKDGYQASEVAIFTYRLKEKTIYTITFDKNGSDVTGTMTAQAFEEGSPVLLNQNSFSRRGYTFAGWNTKADGTGTAYGDRTGVGHIAFGNETAITLYAQWEQILKVATPTADIASGSVVEAGTRVTLSCADEGVEIHYTTDNSIPTIDSPVYTTPIVIGEDMTIKAVAFREGFESSEVLELSYTIAEENSVYTIQFHKNSNQATGEMASQTLEKDGVLFLNGNSFLWEEYYFTGWNTKADGSGTAYKNYDLLFGSDMGSEKVITLYAQWRKMDKLEAVSASVKNQSTVRKGTEVALEHSLDSVQILYTTDGTMPTEESVTYMAPFVITEDIRIMAIAVKEGYMPSEPVEFTYKVAETGEILEEDIPTGGLEEVPEGLWIAGIDPEGYTYTGKAIKPEVRVYDHTTLLEEKKDYTISYSKNINASENGNAKKTPTITVKGKGNYTGKDTAVFKINPKSIVSEDILAQDVSTAYNKKTQKPVPTVYDNGKKLKHKKDYTLEYVGLTSEPGNYKILIHGAGNYSGTRVVEFVITDTNLISKASVSKIKNQPYNEGNEVRPEITVKYKGQELVENADYTVTYLNNTKVGKATVVIRGVNAFSGVKYVNFNITAVSLKGAEINGIYNEEYTGKEIKHEYVTVRLYSVNKILTEGKDYVVSYQNNVKVGKATVTFTGINGYTGTVKKTFKITPYNIWIDNKDKIKVYMDTVAEYVQGGAKPEVVILFDNRKLEENVDYKLTYKHNQVVADDEIYDWDKPEVIITGKGNFKEQFTGQYSIIRKDISGLVSSIQDPVYKNKANAWKAVPKLFDVNGKALKAGKDYEKEMVYTYAEETTLATGTIREAGEEIGIKDIVPAGTVLNVTITGKGKYKGELTAEYRVVQQSVAKAKVKIPTQIYTGKEIKLDKNTISVTCGKQKLGASDYEIISYQNNKQKGTAKVTIKGVGNYGGTKTVAFKIKSKTFLWWK